MPVLVVPSGLLWQVDYLADGSLQTQPRQVSRATLFVSHGWSVDRPDYGQVTYRLSHIEFVTLDALGDATNAWLGKDGFFSPNAV